MKINKKGISLIVLVITIVIMIILAGAVILTLVNSGIIGQTREGMIKNNAANYKSELNMSMSNRILADSGFSRFLINAYTFSDIKEYIPSMKSGDEENFAIQSGDLVYIGGDTNETLLMREMGIGEGFVEGVIYSKVYLNPSISMHPNDLNGVTEIVIQEIVPNVIVTMGYQEVYMVIKKDSIVGTTEQPMALIMIVKDEEILAIYNFTEISFEQDGDTITLLKGWLKVVEDVPFSMSEEEIGEIEINLNTVTGEGKMGNEFLHYYFSTVPY